MHPFPSPYNTGPGACEDLKEAPGARFSTFVLVSALLHLAVMCSFFLWHGEAANFPIAGNSVIEIDLVSIPGMKEPASGAKLPDTIRDETPVKTPVPEAFHTPATKKIVTPAAPATENPPPPVEKQADTPVPAQKEVIAPVEATGITASPAPATGIPDNNVREEAGIGVTARDSSSENSPDGSVADEPIAIDSTGAFIQGEPATASPGQRYVDENFYYVKDLIIRNLTYPVAARRMKWQGTVVVSFVVLEDGTVENIKVVTSSGHGLLDKNLIAAIEQVQPFPAPPAAAEFTMPIKYTLRP